MAPTSYDVDALLVHLLMTCWIKWRIHPLYKMLFWLGVRFSPFLEVDVGARVDNEYSLTHFKVTQVTCKCNIVPWKQIGLLEAWCILVVGGFMTHVFTWRVIPMLHGCVLNLGMDMFMHWRHISSIYGNYLRFVWAHFVVAIPSYEGLQNVKNHLIVIWLSLQIMWMTSNFYFTSLGLF